MSGTDNTICGPSCDDVEFATARLTEARDRSGVFDHLSEYDEPCDDAWDESAQFDGYEGGLDDLDDLAEAGDSIGGEYEEGEEDVDDDVYYGPTGDAPEFEDAEFPIHIQLNPAELAAKGADKVTWKLSTLYPDPFKIPANKGMRDNAALGGVSVVTMENKAPFTVAWWMSLPEDSKVSKVRSLKGKKSVEDNDRITGYTYLGQHFPVPVHGILHPGEIVNEEIPCLSQPETVAESFLSTEGKSHWNKEDMKDTANGVHYFRNRKGLVSLELDHPVAKLAEVHFPDSVNMRDNLIELTESDFNSYIKMLLDEHKSNITLGDARKNLRIHFARVARPDFAKSGKIGKQLDCAWSSEAEICDSLSRDNMEKFEQARDRMLNKNYGIRGRLLVQFAPRRGSKRPS